MNAATHLALIFAAGFRTVDLDKSMRTCGDITFTHDGLIAVTHNNVEVIRTPSITLAIETAAGIFGAAFVNREIRRSHEAFVA